MLLKNFPAVDYRFPNNEYRRIVNFTISVVIDKLNITNKILFKPINIYDVETPEIVSDRVYGTPDYWWVILLVNDVINPFNGWYRSTDVIRKEVANKNDYVYFKNIHTGRIADDVDSARYKEMREKGQPLPEHINYFNRYDYEVELNSKRNDCWIISPDYIYDFVDEYENALKLFFGREG